MKKSNQVWLSDEEGNMLWKDEIESYQSESKWAPIAFTIFLVVAFLALLAGWIFI